MDMYTNLSFLFLRFYVLLNRSISFKENSLPSLSCLSCQYINNPANTILSTTEKKMTDAVGKPVKIQGFSHT